MCWSYLIEEKPVKIRLHTFVGEMTWLYKKGDSVGCFSITIIKQVCEYS